MNTNEDRQPELGDSFEFADLRQAISNAFHADVPLHVVTSLAQRIYAEMEEASDD